MFARVYGSLYSTELTGSDSYNNYNNYYHYYYRSNSHDGGDFCFTERAVVDAGCFRDDCQHTITTHRTKGGERSATILLLLLLLFLCFFKQTRLIPKTVRNGSEQHFLACVLSPHSLPFSCNDKIAATHKEKHQNDRLRAHMQSLTLDQLLTLIWKRLI